MIKTVVKKLTNIMEQHNTHCKLNVKQNSSSFHQLLYIIGLLRLHIFVTKEMMNRKGPNVKFRLTQQTDEKLISLTNGRLKIFDFLKFMKLGLDTKLKALILFPVEKLLGDEWEFFTKNLVCPYD